MYGLDKGSKTGHEGQGARQTVPAPESRPAEVWTLRLVSAIMSTLIEPEILLNCKLTDSSFHIDSHHHFNIDTCTRH